MHLTPQQRDGDCANPYFLILDLNFWHALFYVDKFFREEYARILALQSRHLNAFDEVALSEDKQQHHWKQG